MRRIALIVSPTVSRSSGTPSRFDASFFRAHDPLSYIPADHQALKSQSSYTSGLPAFAATSGPFSQTVQRANGSAKHGQYTNPGYAGSIISQDPRAPSTIETSSILGSSVAPSERGGHINNIAYSQSDRLRRRLSFSSLAGVSDLGSVSAVDYKSQDDSADLDALRSQYSHSQAGLTQS